MVVADLLTAVYAYVEAHGGRFPARGYVSPETASLFGPEGYVLPADGRFGQHALGVGEWWTDRTMPNEQVRFEGERDRTSHADA